LINGLFRFQLSIVFPAFSLFYYFVSLDVSYIDPEEEGMFLEVKPLDSDLEDNSSLSNSTSSDLSSNLSSSMVGSRVIDDYDPEDRGVQEDNVMYPLFLSLPLTSPFSLHFSRAQ
jgi:hypothetical protein